MAADDNRSINICLINTLKPTEDLPDNNRVGIDHVNSFIWFDDKKQRDGYFALKTVFSQTQNSKVHDFNSPDAFRLNIKMKDYYKLDADLLKINHTVEGLEDEYIYNIVDVEYVNNEVTKIYVELNEIYTYFFDDATERTRIQGSLMKSNFKNQNFDMAYVNEMTKGLIGDNYGATDYTSSSKKLAYKEDFDELGVSWLAISLRKKPSVIDGVTQDTDYSDTLGNSFTDEIVLTLPFNNTDSKGRQVKIGDNPARDNNLDVGYISYLLLNGTIKFSTDDKTSLAGKLQTEYDYIDVLPFTFASMYDVSEIGVVPDYPCSYSEAGTVTLPSGTNEIALTLTDKVKGTTSKVYLASMNALSESNLHLRRDDIITNAEKQTKLLDGFENWENNIIYNNYFLKYYNSLVTLNPYNLLGSNQDVFVSSVYMGSGFKKLFVSTDLYIQNLSTIDQLTAVQNTDFMIKYAGTAEGGSTLNNYLADNMITDIDSINSIFKNILTGLGGAAAGAAAGAATGSIAPGVGTAIGAVGGAVVGGVSSALSASNSKKSANMRNVAGDFNQQGGISGYQVNQFNASPMFSDLKEYVPKIVYERSGNTKTIDNLTNFYGTSCSLYTENLKAHVQEVINNRTNHKCYIAGDFNVNFLYPQVNQRLKSTLQRGVLFMRKLQ